MTKKILKGLLVFTLAISLLVSCGAKQEKKEEKTQAENPETVNLQPQVQEDIEVSDAEITKFISASNKLRSSQAQMRKKLMSIIQESDLGMQKYQTIAQAKRNPKDTTQAEKFTQEDLQAFDNLNKEIRQIQQENAEKIAKQEGIAFERFKTISSAARNDTILQKRLRAEAMKQNPPKKPKINPNQ